MVLEAQQAKELGKSTLCLLPHSLTTRWLLHCACLTSTAGIQSIPCSL